ncbi:MAG: Gfo/Idh/MocA family protein [Rubrobacteraceae bacterium]
MEQRAVRVAVIGCGLMAREHVRELLKKRGEVDIVVVSDPSPSAYEAMRDLFVELELEPPPNEPDPWRLLDPRRGRAEVALIVTPHKFHFEHAKAAMEAGLDVLLEKPMVTNAREALDLIDVRDRTGRLLVISFNGSLSPQVRLAAQMLRSGELGDVLSISATVWEGWASSYDGHWKQDPEVSGGGFMLDTGAHMLNTVADLAGEDFVEVAAWLDTRGRRKGLDITGTVMAKLASGALVSMCACGETIPACSSDVRVFCTKGIIHTDVWGRWLGLQREGEPVLRPLEDLPSRGPWEQFLAVRNGSSPNPCPPEVGLRMALLWDAIGSSARRDGVPVEVEDFRKELAE